MNFEFATAQRIIFGPGGLNKLGILARQMGQRALVVTGIGPAGTERLVGILSEAGVTAVVMAVEGEPTVDFAESGVALARREKAQIVIGLGGGSALDAGKAIAALCTNPGAITDYLEVVGQGKALIQTPLPVIAIPTTAGTGSEVTRNAVLGVPAQRVKVSLRSPMMLPRLALVDPELTYSLPPAVTASTGLDALTQLIEPYVCNQANPLTDALCLEGLKRAARSLKPAYERGDDASAREDMSLASLMGGLALANAKLGAVHGFAAPLGGMYTAPHGAVCARLLPWVMEMNVRLLQQRFPDSPALARYDEIGRILTGNMSAAAQDGLVWVEQVCKDFNIPPLAQYGLVESDLPELIEKSAKASSMQGNPVQLTKDEMRIILLKAMND
ncbi:MAG: iron-containing alcohol dehydrogenase [Anaerolineales bacterium]|nr:iron-containing alcohol dehydrogenase [Anaerolineales bacterium]